MSTSNRVISRIRAKVTRAETHIQDFNLGLAAFSKTNPYKIAAKEDADKDQRVFYLAHVDPLPDELATIASDVIQNLRSTLDILAYQIVLHERGGTAPDWKVYFPFAGSSGYYRATCGGVIKGVRQEVVDAFDATEPYPDGKGRTLWQLKELSNPDKHEFLLTTGLVNVGVDMTMVVKPHIEKFLGREMNLNPLFIREVNAPPLKVGDELYREPLDFEMKGDRRFGIGVSLEKPGVIESGPANVALKEFSNLVNGVVNRFEPLFS